MERRITVRFTREWCKERPKQTGDATNVTPAMKSTDDHETPAVQETGFSWVVLAASFLGRMMYSLCLGYGLFQVVLLEEFKGSRGATALVGAICNGFATAGGPLASLLCNWLGHRVTCMLGSVLITIGYIISAFSPGLTLLYFSYGVLIGLGVAFTLIPCTVMVSFYFGKHRNLATGIVMAGSGLGSLVFPLITQYFIDTYSWRSAMIMLGGISLQGCIAGALLWPNRELIPEPPDENIEGADKTDRTKNILQYDLFKEPNFVLLIIVLTFKGLSCTLYFTISPDRVVGYGLTPDQAALLLSVVGICSTVARFLYGVTTSFFRCNNVILYLIFVSLLSIPHFILILDRPSFGVLVFGSAVFGVLFGACATHILPLAVELFGLHRVTAAFGCLLLGEGIGAFIGPPTAGGLYDIAGDYMISFIFSTGVSVMGGLLNIPIYFLQRRKRKTVVVGEEIEALKT